MLTTTIMGQVGGNDADDGSDMETFCDDFISLSECLADKDRRITVSGLLPRKTYNLNHTMRNSNLYVKKITSNSQTILIAFYLHRMKYHVCVGPLRPNNKCSVMSLPGLNLLRMILICSVCTCLNLQQIRIYPRQINYIVILQLLFGILYTEPEI